jgi:hypothetical protein
MIKYHIRLIELLRNSYDLKNKALEIKVVRFSINICSKVFLLR